MFRDSYYIKSLVATFVFMAIVLMVLTLAVYTTGIAGFAVLSITVLIFFLILYGWHRRSTDKDLPGAKNIPQVTKERL